MIEEFAGFARRPQCCSGGAAAVEFALVLPVVLILIVGAVSYGSMMYQQTMLEAAVRAGAAYAQTRPNKPAEIEQAVKDAVPYSVPTVPAPTTFCTCSDNTVPTGSKVTNGCPNPGQANPCSGVGTGQLLRYVAVSASASSWSWFFSPATLKASAVVRVQ